MSTPATADLATTPGVVAIERDIVRVQGTDALSFLQGQLSQDVEALADGAGAPSFLLQPTGKVEAWLRVTRLAGDEFVLDVDCGWGEAVVARLKRFRLRTKADLEGARWSGVALRGPGAGAIGWDPPPPGALRLAASLYGAEAIDVLGPEGTVVAAGASVVGIGALDALRIERGVPAMGAEIGEATIPAELGQAVIDASVSFTKGCYTGQELVARIDSRGGNVPHPIRGLRVDGDVPAVGATLHLDHKQVGRVTSAARSAAFGAIALAVVGRAVEIGQTVEVRGPDGTALGTISDLPLR